MEECEEHVKSMNDQFKDSQPPGDSPLTELRSRSRPRPDDKEHLINEYSSQSEFLESQYRSQFYDTSSVKPPKASIVRAVVLLIIGTVLTIVGSLLLSGYFHSIYADRTWPVLTIGLMCFIPGFYYTRIACYAYKGYPGFSYTDIPGED